jgi:phosphoribosylglycinamide formyltransferase-1
MGRLRLGVLVSGSGTNLQAILDSCAAGEMPAEVAVVVSNAGDAFGLERARRAGVPAVFLDPKDHVGREAYNHALLETLRAHDVECVVMAGYMRLLGAEVLDAYPMHVLNLHPALLPSFPGAHGISDAFEWGVKVTGVTVHFANEVFDEGPIIMQEPVRIEEDDMVETLEARIHAVEHRLYPAAIKAVSEGRVVVQGRKVRILPGA